MFKTSTRPRVIHPVPFHIEVDGVIVDNSFTATFQILPIERTIGDALDSDQKQTDFLTESVVNMADLDVPFTAELRAELLGRIEVRGALLRAYFDAAKKAAAKN